MILCTYKMENKSYSLINISIFSNNKPVNSWLLKSRNTKS